MFGINKNKNESKPDLETPATYIGGHKIYPKSHTCHLKIYADHIEITKPELSIPFSAMRKVEYSKKPTFGMVASGVKTYTIIEYQDGNETQTIGLLVVDIIGHRYLEKTQAMLYERMKAAQATGA